MDDSKGGGSFIPKRSVPKPAARVGRRVYVFSYVAYVVFFGTLMSVVGVFVIHQQTENKLNEVVAAVEEAQGLFNRDQLDSLQSLDRRLKTANDLLDQHVAVSDIFRELEVATLEEVQFTSFNYSREEGEDNIILSLESQTGDFDQVIVQRDTLAENEKLSQLNIYEVAYGEGDSVGDELGAGGGSALLGLLNQVAFSIEGALSVSSFAYSPRDIDESEDDIPSADEADLVDGEAGAATGVDGSDNLNQ